MNQSGILRHRIRRVRASHGNFRQKHGGSYRLDASCCLAPSLTGNPSHKTMKRKLLKTSLPTQPEQESDKNTKLEDKPAIQQQKTQWATNIPPGGPIDIDRKLQ